MEKMGLRRCWHEFFGFPEWLEKLRTCPLISAWNQVSLLVLKLIPVKMAEKMKMAECETYTVCNFTEQNSTLKPVNWLTEKICMV